MLSYKFMNHETLQSGITDTCVCIHLIILIDMLIDGSALRQKPISTRMRSLAVWGGCTMTKLFSQKLFFTSGQM